MAMIICPMINECNIVKENGKYAIYYRDTPIITGCINYSYLNHRLVVVKKEDQIYVYVFSCSNNSKPLEELAHFWIKSSNVGIKLTVDEENIFIDENCQITSRGRTH